MTVAWPKPARGTARGERKRAWAAERKLIKTLRMACVRRDHYHCRARDLGDCSGPLEMAHLEDHRRSKTGGQAPERRHQLPYLAMLCRFHHWQYDRRRIDLVFLDPARGANADLEWRVSS